MIRTASCSRQRIEEAKRSDVYRLSRLERNAPLSDLSKFNSPQTGIKELLKKCRATQWHFYESPTPSQLVLLHPYVGQTLHVSQSWHFTMTLPTDISKSNKVHIFSVSHFCIILRILRGLFILL